MPTYHLKLKHPSGRMSIKKFQTKKKSPKAVRLAYLGSPHHFRTEASVVKISKKRKALK